MIEIIIIITDRLHFITTPRLYILGSLYASDIFSFFCFFLAWSWKLCPSNEGSGTSVSISEVFHTILELLCLFGDFAKSIHNEKSNTKCLLWSFIHFPSQKLLTTFSKVHSLQSHDALGLVCQPVKDCPVMTCPAIAGYVAQLWPPNALHIARWGHSHVILSIDLYY